MEEASQVEETVAETGEVVESADVSTTTDGEGGGEVVETTLELGDGTLEGTHANLDTIRETLKNIDPAVATQVESAIRSVYGDYTQKTQEAAAIKRAYEEYAVQKDQEHQERMAQFDPSALPNFDNMEPADTMNWLLSEIDRRNQASIDQRIGPMQDQVAASAMDRELDTLYQQNPQFDDELLKTKVGQIAGEGLTPQTAFMAADYQRVVAENTKLKNAQTKKTAGAISQAGVSATDVSTRETGKTGSSWEEAKANAIRRFEAGELD